MSSIAFFTAHRAFPWARQLRPDHVFAGGVRITIDREDTDCRLLVVYDEPPAGLSTCIPRENRLLIVSEPPGIKRYRKGFVEQFGAVLGPIRPESDEVRWIERQPSLPWFYGIAFTPGGLQARLSVDELAAMEPPEKRPEISVVISSKSQLPKHRARLAFVEKLKARLGDRLHIFGRGFHDIQDKAEAIDPFAYHLVLENNDIAHFFTEKTADALLGWSLPVFSGCSNIGDYFPQGSYVPVNIDQPYRAMSAIEELLDQDVYATHLADIGEARRRLIQELGLAECLTGLVRAMPMPIRTTAESLHATSAFSFLGRLRRLARR